MCSTSSVGSGDPVQDVLDARQASTQSQIQYTVAAKALQASKDQGEAIVSLIQSIAPQGKAIGQGTQFDAVG